MGDLGTRVSNSIAAMQPKVRRAMLDDRHGGEGRCFVLKNGLYVNFVVPVQVRARPPAAHCRRSPRR